MKGKNSLVFLVLVLFIFEIESCYVDHACLEFMILLPHPPEY
jgi:hypothetical protein